MKKIAAVFVLALCFLLAACGRNSDEPEGMPALAPLLPSGGDNAPPQEQQPIVSDVPRPPAASGGVSLRAPEVREGLAGIPILWGYNPAMYGNDTNLSLQLSLDSGFLTGAGIDVVLSNWFDVALEGVHITDIKDVLAMNPRPDLFLADPIHARQLGLNRTIPEEMVRRYAPNYAALLDAHDGWAVSLAPNGEQLALNTYNLYARDLDIFSVYRLEWLEEMDIALPGNMFEIADGVFFTDESYSHGDFTFIMDSFVRFEPNPHTDVPMHWSQDALEMARERTWAIEVNLLRDVVQAIAPVLGIFGVNIGIMEEGGSAMPYFATRAYREALLYLEDLAAREALFFYAGNDPHSAFMCHYVRVGWSSVRTQDLFRVIHAAQAADPGRRFLIAPPHGVGFSSGEPFNQHGTAWVIGSHVDDDTLSRILNMFDEMSFSPDLVALTNYGFDSQSIFYDPAHSTGITIGSVSGITAYEWAGEPHNSRVNFLRPPAAELREGLFATGIIDGIAWQRRFTGEFVEVSRFAAGPGMMHILRPARADTDGAFAVERLELDNRYREALDQAVFRFLLDVMIGNIRVASEWDAYLERLYDNGLQAYIDLYSQFPPTP